MYIYIYTYIKTDDASLLPPTHEMKPKIPGYQRCHLSTSSGARICTVLTELWRQCLVLTRLNHNRGSAVNHDVSTLFVQHRITHLKPFLFFYLQKNATLEQTK